jgi:protein phosphatase PTC7
LKVATFNNPHYEKRYKGGEDGYSVSDDHRFIMVCDGVGGWAKKGVDAGKTAKFVACKVCELFSQNPSRPFKEMLQEAVNANPNRGSTTAVMAKVEPKVEGDASTLTTCNLGDSGYMIVRPMESGTWVRPIYRSKEQQHYFNCPYQCGENHAGAPMKA